MYDIVAQLARAVRKFDAPGFAVVAGTSRVPNEALAHAHRSIVGGGNSGSTAGAMRSGRAQRAQWETDVANLTRGATLTDEPNFAGARTRLIVHQSRDAVSIAAKRVIAAGALIQALKKKS